MKSMISSQAVAGGMIHAPQAYCNTPSGLFQ
jgi:hypothetical protein